MPWRTCCLNPSLTRVCRVLVCHIATMLFIPHPRQQRSAPCAERANAFDDAVSAAAGGASVARLSCAHGIRRGRGEPGWARRLDATKILEDTRSASSQYTRARLRSAHTRRCSLLLTPAAHSAHCGSPRRSLATLERTTVKHPQSSIKIRLDLILIECHV